MLLLDLLIGFGDASKALNAIDVVVASRLTIRIKIRLTR